MVERLGRDRNREHSVFLIGRAAELPGQRILRVRDERRIEEEQHAQSHTRPDERGRDAQRGLGAAADAFDRAPSSPPGLKADRPQNERRIRIEQSSYVELRRDEEGEDLEQVAERPAQNDLPKPADVSDEGAVYTPAGQ